jgi:glucokinase
MNNTKGRNNRHVKNMNRYLILQCIRDFGPITKVAVAFKTNLTFTAINNIVDDLIQSGLILEEGYDSSSGGRKPVLLNLKADAIFMMGVHVSISTIRSAVINFRGEPIVINETKLTDNSDKELILGQIFESIESIIAGFGLNSESLVGIGLGVPGPLDPYKGVVLSPPNLKGLTSVPLRDLIEQRFGLPTMIDKDANVMALGELWYGNGRGYDNFVYLDADIGIGSGLIFNRKIYHGFPYGAGEIGHGTIDIDGPRCNCGNYGCLEAVASGIAVIRRIGEEIRRGVSSELASQYQDYVPGVDIQAIMEAAQNKDSLALGVLNESARYIGIALANMINLLTPETIIIGGVLVNQHPDYFDEIKSIALSRSFASFRREVLLKPSHLKVHAGVIGAGTLMLEHYLLNLR